MRSGIEKFAHHRVTIVFSSLLPIQLIIRILLFILRSLRLSDQWNVENVRPTPAAFDLSFKIISSAKRVVSKVLLGTPIQMKATLFDPTGEIEFLEIRSSW